MSLLGYLIWYIWVGVANNVSAVGLICLVTGSEYNIEVWLEEYCPPTWLKNEMSDILTIPFSACINLLNSDILTFWPKFLTRGLKKSVTICIVLAMIDPWFWLLSNTISTLTSATDLTLSSSGTSFVTIDGVLKMPIQASGTSVNPGTNIAIYGKDPAIGNSGVWYKNKDAYEDELISTNRSLLFSMLF